MRRSWIALIALNRMLSNDRTFLRIEAQTPEVLIGDLYRIKDLRPLLLLHGVLLVSINF